MKKIKFFALAALALLSTNAMAAPTFPVDYSANGLDYKILSETTASVVGITEGSPVPETLTIETITCAGTAAEAAEINGLECKIIAIEDNAFKGKTAIKKVVLPSTVVTIGESAFEGLTALTVANFTWNPSAASTIGASAFKGCSSFAGAYTLPRKVTEIGESAFQNTGLTSLTIGTNGKSSLAEIGGYFIDGTAITELDLTPASGLLSETGDYHIADYAFSSSALKKVIFASGYDEENDAYDDECPIVEIPAGTGGVSMFTGATAVEEIVFPSTLEEIGEGALASTVLKSIDLHVTALTTVENLFSASASLPYSSLKGIVFPAAALTVKASAFAYCTGLTTLEIPATWGGDGMIQNSAFLGCTGLTTVTYKPSAAIIGAFSVDATNLGIFQVNAFKDCKTAPATISIATSEAYVTKMGGEAKVPTNCKYDYTKTVPQDDIWKISFATGSNNQAFKVMADEAANATYGGWKVSAADAMVYSCYVDDDGSDDSDGTIYIFPYRVTAGYYYVTKGDAVIIKSKGESTVNAIRMKTADWTAGPGSTHVYGTDLDVNLTTGTTVTSLAGTDYLHVGAIKNGVVGFGKPASNSLARGTYYVVTKKPYSASGRMNVVWVDENDATAIQAIQNKAKSSDNAIYNLRGEKVNAAYKGLVIKNGKKYIQK